MRPARPSRRCWPRRRPPAYTPSTGTPALPRGRAGAQRPRRVPRSGASDGQDGRRRTARPGKGNTLLNHCGIRSDLLAFSVDRSPYKQGKFLPGTHIPIHPVGALAEATPDYVLILPWNLRDEISAQLAYVRSWGGRLVVAIPELEIVWEGDSMKVVLFCGGLGMRMRDGPQSLPSR